MWRQFLTRILLGRKKEYCEFMKIKNKMYEVIIRPYVSAEDLFKAAVNSGVLTADNFKTKDE